jgi:hypothetical protein
MRPSFTWSGRARQVLAEQLSRLQQTFGRLAQYLRESIAGAIGRAVSDILSEVMTGVLDGCSAAPDYHHHSEYRPWQDEPDELPFEDEPLTEPSQGGENRQPRSRWRFLLSTTLQSLAWWLRQSRMPVWTALGAAAASGLVAYAGSPFLATAVGVIGSVVSLLSLAETTRSGVAALGNALIP